MDQVLLHYNLLFETTHAIWKKKHFTYLRSDTVLEEH